MQVQSDHEEPLYHHVPDEVCVVVSNFHPRIDGQQHVITDAQHNRLYDALRAFLNTEIPRRFAQTGHMGELRKLIDAGGPLVRPLDREQISQDPAVRALRPWASFPRAYATKTLYSYKVGPPPAVDAERPVNQPVTELVNFINDNLRLELVPPQGLAPGGAQIVAASRNWLSGAAQGGGNIGGGPGSEPEPVPPDQAPKPAPAGQPQPGRFRFGNEQLNQLVERQRAAADTRDGQCKVVVAVLDTSPSRSKVVAAADGHRDNWLLQEVKRGIEDGSVVIAEDGSAGFADASQIASGEPLDPRYFSVLGEILPNWKNKRPAKNRGVPRAHYRMPDHGLFAVGMIRDIAPTAEIHLIRVLNDNGVGDLVVLTQLLEALPDTLLAGRGPDARLVISLSLMVEEADERHACPTIEHQNLSEAIDWLNARDDVLVVAAAGNRRHAHQEAPAPCLPARYDSVLGVAAVNGKMAPARYSNRGDVVVFGNGVSVFGGNVKEPPAGQDEELAIDPLPDGRLDAAKGIFSEPNLPISNASNDTGWVYWAGTSFATPIISAIVADLWAEAPGLSPEAVIAQITSPSVPGGGGFAERREVQLDCLAINAEQM